MKRPRRYIKRLYVELDDVKEQYEELDVKDFGTIAETTAMSEEHVMRLLDLRAF